MRLELDEISAEGITREYSASADNFPELQTLAGTAGFEIASPVEFHLRLQRAGHLVELDGQLTVRVKEICGRCLSPFDEQIASTFALTFTAQKESASDEEEVELEADELGLISYEGEQIDLLHPLQEQVVMSLPISPLCKEDCLGLCSECGVNLNATSCSCEKKLFNNKFAALKNLKLDP